MNGQTRKNIYPGLLVDIVLKADQPTGKLTRGTVQQLLTSSPIHPRGIKVRLTSGQVGRVQHIVSPSDSQNSDSKTPPAKIQPTAKVTILPASTTFSELFEILSTTDPTQRFSRFYKMLDEHFTPDIVDEVYDFQLSPSQTVGNPVVLEYFASKGYSKDALTEFLSLKLTK